MSNTHRTCPNCGSPIDGGMWTSGRNAGQMFFEHRKNEKFDHARCPSSATASGEEAAWKAFLNTTPAVKLTSKDALRIIGELNSDEGACSIIEGFLWTRHGEHDDWKERGFLVEPPNKIVLHMVIAMAPIDREDHMELRKTFKAAIASKHG